MKIVELVLKPEEAFDEEKFNTLLYNKLGLKQDGSVFVRPVKRSIDARSKNVVVRIQCEIARPEEVTQITYEKKIRNLANSQQVVIVGSGPAGLFAGLRLIESGLKPILLERGNDVQSRRRDLAAINKDHIVNPESNYCFGEGGAGTYSDGKLYTRSKKRGDIRKVLETLVSHGARQDILFDAHPHIGTNKLPQLVASLRQTILDCGGEIHFNTKVADFIIDDDTMNGVVLASSEKIIGEGVILATGHSARDIFHLLEMNKIQIEVKPFALGVRV